MRANFAQRHKERVTTAAVREASARKLQPGGEEAAFERKIAGALKDTLRLFVCFDCQHVVASAGFGLSCFLQSRRMGVLFDTRLLNDARCRLELKTQISTQALRMICPR